MEIPPKSLGCSPGRGLGLSKNHRKRSCLDPFRGNFLIPAMVRVSSTIVAGDLANCSVYWFFNCPTHGPPDPDPPDTTRTHRHSVATQVQKSFLQTFLQKKKEAPWHCRGRRPSWRNRYSLLPRNPAWSPQSRMQLRQRGVELRQRSAMQTPQSMMQLRPMARCLKRHILGAGSPVDGDDA